MKLAWTWKDGNDKNEIFDVNNAGQKTQGDLTGFVFEWSKLDAKLNGSLFLKKLPYIHN
jgi:hypothetical protein